MGRGVRRRRPGLRRPVASGVHQGAGGGEELACYLRGASGRLGGRDLHELDRHAGPPEELNLFRVRAVVVDEDPGGGKLHPRMERPFAEFGGIRENVDGVAPPRHEFLEPCLRLVRLAQANVHRDGVRAQEHTVELIRSRAASAMGPTKVWLTPRRRPPRQSTSIPGESASSWSVLMPGVVMDRFSRSRRACASAPSVEPPSSRIFSPSLTSEAAQAAMACFCSNASPVRWRRDGWMRAQRHRPTVGPGELSLLVQAGQVPPDRGRGHRKMPRQFLHGSQARGHGEVVNLFAPGFGGGHRWLSFTGCVRSPSGTPRRSAVLMLFGARPDSVHSDAPPQIT